MSEELKNELRLVDGEFEFNEREKQAVKESLGASVISRIAVQEELGNKKLQEITIRNLRMKRKFYLVRQKKRTLPSHYAAFCSHLKKGCDFS